MGHRGMELSSHPISPLSSFPCPCPYTARCIMLCLVAGFSPVLLIRVCGHIFSLTIFNPHFAYSPFSLFFFPLSRQQNIKKKKNAPQCAERSRIGGKPQELAAGAALTR